MSSDSASSEVTYTSILSHGDPLAWAVDFFRLQEPNSPEAAPASPRTYVPGPEEPEQAPLLPDYLPGPEYPEYLAPSDKEVPMDRGDSSWDYQCMDGDGVFDDRSSNVTRGGRASHEEEAEEEEEGGSICSGRLCVVAPLFDHVPLFGGRQSRLRLLADHTTPVTVSVGEEFDFWLLRPSWKVRQGEAAEEIASVTLEGVNTRDRQTQIFQNVEALIDDRQYHYEMPVFKDNGWL
ncbi:hypothetical protein Tco_0734427 [Tanacetum coccineum]